ncbi:helix-turn-helix domain-containing protein [Carnobacterium maltaromaticum]|uniref:helix-turn-helix domain-containing protein n=1 Tax=Carnobacterium TaxID=2747 RepID=UPI001071833F|nr:helix-turn-helix transcriptional regulator [Carnobacterium divergens]TFI72265.1 transcriptional regulator [Carnobacterium divergens]
MAFGDKLKQLRENRDMKQKELAELLYLRQSSVSDYENNKSIPSGEIINKLTKIFNVSADYLLDIETPNKSTLDKTIEETMEELKNENTLLFMKDNDIDEETARLVKIALKNAMKTVDDMKKKD